MFPNGRYPTFFYCKEVRKQIYFRAHWCVSAASSLIYRSCTLSGFGQRRQWDGGGRGKDFCLPPARSSSDVYFQEGAVIIAVEVGRKWLRVVFRLFIWQLLEAVDGPRARTALCGSQWSTCRPRCSRDTPSAHKRAFKFFCLQTAFRESYKNRTPHMGYLVKRVFTQ